MLTATLIFWIAAGLIVYSYAGYPLLLWLLTALRRTARPAPPAALPEPMPFVSLIFAAHNEEKVIAQKMANLAQLDYPADRLEILIGADACTDRTVKEVNAARHPAVRLFESATRTGKPAALNRLVAQARGEVLVFSDANTFFEPGAVKALVAALGEARVGAACGHMILRDPTGRESPEVGYWGMESRLKVMEGRLGGVLGANGGIYALRRDLFKGIPDHTIIDDFVIAMKVYETGHRVAYVPSAVAREDVAPSIEAEFHRRARIASGCFQAIAMTWRALNPLLGFPALAYWSHKVLRWIAPFLYLAAVAANVALAAGGSKFFAALLVMQALFFGLAAAGWLLRRAPRSPVLFRLPFYFVTLNAAFIAGFIRWLCGIRSAVWQPAGR